MPSVWKEVLLPGRQQTADGEWFTISRRKVLQAYRNARLMLSRGVPIPAVWEHVDVEAGDTDAWKARYAKYTFAHIDDARINARGGLDLRHDVPDPRDVAQLAKTKYVSPKVYPSYSDSRGGQYHGTTIAHVAATPTPVQFWQRPFELSQRGALYLSYLPEGSPVADENDDKTKGGDKGGTAAAGAELNELIEALRAKGLTISDRVSTIPELLIAIESSGGLADGVDDDLDDDLGTPPDGTAPAGGAPVLMSTTDRNPQAKAQALSWARTERADMKARVRGLFQSGRVDGPTARQLLRQAGAVEMSFTREGAAVCPLLNKLAEYEKREPSAAWQATGLRDGRELSATRTVDRPKDLNADGQAEAAADAEARVRRLTGQPAPTK
ncbi:unnamed protein product [Gemmataceae bacterium]|nr:unnamed protein product [Gemmataceae bacterium]VTT96556.1 unnamed protein product [Gemmataceae bacterium]